MTLMLLAWLAPSAHAVDPFPIKSQCPERCPGLLDIDMHIMPEDLLLGWDREVGGLRNVLVEVQTNGNLDIRVGRYVLNRDYVHSSTERSTVYLVPVDAIAALTVEVTNLNAWAPWYDVSITPAGKEP